MSQNRKKCPRGFKLECVPVSGGLGSLGARKYKPSNWTFPRKSLVRKSEGMPSVTIPVVVSTNGSRGPHRLSRTKKTTRETALFDVRWAHKYEGEEIFEWLSRAGASPKSLIKNGFSRDEVYRIAGETWKLRPSVVVDYVSYPLSSEDVVLLMAGKSIRLSDYQELFLEPSSVPQFSVWLDSVLEQGLPNL